MADRITSTDSEVMTLSEIARYLKVSEKTVLRMLRAGEIPGAKVASQWRFVRTAIDDWLNARMYALPRKGLFGVINTEDRIVPIAELVSSQRIVLDIESGPIESILEQLVSVVRGTSLVDDVDEFLSQLIAREDMVSTAVGHGLAVPHARSPEHIKAEAPFMIIGVCAQGVAFNALDGRKTHVFAVPCSNSESEHLRMMAKISLLFRQTGIIKRMCAAKSPKEIIEILKETDRDIESRCGRNAPGQSNLKKPK